MSSVSPSVHSTSLPPVVPSQEGRKRSLGADEEGPDDGPERPAQRSRAVSAQLIPKKDVEAAGRVLCRACCPWLDYSEVLQFAVSRDPEQLDYELSPRQREHVEALDLLYTLLPTLRDQLLNDDDDSTCLKRVEGQLLAGRRDAAATDVNTLKLSLPDWLPGPHNIKPKVKEFRGFKSEATGQLLCPFNRDWSLASVKAGIRTGKIPVKSDTFPNFLFEDNKCGDLTNVAATLGRGPILFQGYSRLFIGGSVEASTAPKPVDASDSSEDCLDGQATAAAIRIKTSSLAYKCRMECATPSTLAYTATLLRSAISADETFSLNKSTAFDYEAFYRGFRKWFNDEDTECIDALYQWWNSRLFPHYIPAGTDSSAEANESLDLLAAQREARRLNQASITV